MQTYVMERRTAPAALKIDGARESVPDAIGELTGYAVVYNVITDLGFYLEQVSPGAFAESLLRDDIRALWNHDTGLPLGRNRAGTLELTDEKKGLGFRILLPDTRAGRDALTSVERGDVTGVSFGFQIKKEEWQTLKEGQLRTIKKALLHEISIVTFPAYPTTSVEVVPGTRLHVPFRGGSGGDRGRLLHLERARKIEAAEREIERQLKTIEQKKAIREHEHRRRQLQLAMAE